MRPTTPEKSIGERERANEGVTPVALRVESDWGPLIQEIREHCRLTGLTPSESVHVWRAGAEAYKHASRLWSDRVGKMANMLQPGPGGPVTGGPPDGGN